MGVERGHCSQASSLRVGIGAFCSPSSTGNFAAQVCEQSRSMQASAGAAGGCQLEHLTSKRMHSGVGSHGDRELGCEHPIADSCCVSRTTGTGKRVASIPQLSAVVYPDFVFPVVFPDLARVQHGAWTPPLISVLNTTYVHVYFSV